MKYYLMFLVLLLLVVSNNIANAQCCLVMKYDADGNRISRIATTNCIEQRETVEVQELRIVEEIKIYPNPNNGAFKIIMQGFVKQEAYYELFNINGVLVLTNKLYDDITEVDVGTASAGIYLLRIKNGDEVISKIVLIQ